MKNDYLWDRSGEPDPEIQQLEEVLGTLRYQPQPLELPAELRPVRQPRHFPTLAIAATIVLMILAVGLWVRLHRRPAPATEAVQGQQPPTGKSSQSVNVESPTPDDRSQHVAKTPNQDAIKPVKRTIKGTLRKRAASGNTLAKNRNRTRNSSAPQDQMSKAQLDEGRAAKEQLMLALRVTSAKLNFAQRKMQGPPLPSTIHNQHKVG